MPGFDHSVLTDVGWDALTDAEAGQHIEYTHLEAGDGYVYGGDTEIYGMTNLVSKVMDFPITNFTNDGQGQITLIGVISSKNVTTGFDFREIGVRCTIDGGPSILYAVANSGDEADYIPSSAESGVVIQTVQIIIKIDRATNVTVIIQPGLDVTAQNIGEATVGPGYFRDKVGQILWFKRINSPKKTLTLTETSDLVSIDIPVVDVNLDMWVALGNPDIFPHFSTIQKALNYLIPLRINPGIFVTIWVAAGVWENSVATIVDHRDGPQIKIIGTIGVPKTIANVSGNNTSVRLDASAGAGTFNDMVVGDYFYYKNYPGSGLGGQAISGIWQVVTKAADGSYITFYPRFLVATFPDLGPVSGGTVTPLKTVIKCVPQQSAITLEGAGLGLLKNFALIGGAVSGANGGGAGVNAHAGISRLEYIGATNWYSHPSIGGGIGFASSNTASIDCYDCSGNRNLYGFNMGELSAQYRVYECFAHSNTYGFSNIGGQTILVYSNASGNSFSGASCSHTGLFHIDRLWSAYNTYGFFCSAAGHVEIHANTSGVASACGFSITRDVHIQTLASMIRGNGPAMSYSTANIAPNTLSYDGCWFSP